MEIDYKKAWLKLKETLSNVEQNGNMLAQTMAYSQLEMLKEIEKECIKKEKKG